MSYLETALGLAYPPLAIFYAQVLPPGLEPAKPICAMFHVARAAKGETVAMSLASCRCAGAPSGLGLDRFRPENFPGGSECFLRFLSIGNEGWENGRAAMERLKESGAPKGMVDEFTHGEGFLKSTDLVQEWLDGLPEVRPEGPFIVVKPMSALQGDERPKAVCFLVNPDQLSALVVLANYGRKGRENVAAPFGAGCHCIGLYPFDECGRESPRAIIGLTDISARFYVGRSLGRDILSFTVPFSMYEEMESDAPGSFLSRTVWKAMTATIPGENQGAFERP